MIQILRALFLSMLLVSPLLATTLTESVTIVCEDDFAPYGYRGHNGQAAGFSTDVIIAAYQTVGVDVTFRVLPYARGMYLISKGVEVGCYNTNNDAINLRDHYFPSEPLFKGEMVLWARNDYQGRMTLKKLAQTGQLVGVTHGYNYDAPGVDFDYNPEIKKDPAKSVYLTLKKLVAGRYDLAAAEKKVAMLAIARHQTELGGKVQVVGKISEPGLYLSFSKKHPDGLKFCNLLSRGIENIRRNGEYQRLEQRWEKFVQTGVIP